MESPLALLNYPSAKVGSKEPEALPIRYSNKGYQSFLPTRGENKRLSAHYIGQAEKEIWTQQLLWIGLSFYTCLFWISSLTVFPDLAIRIIYQIVAFLICYYCLFGKAWHEILLCLKDRYLCILIYKNSLCCILFVLVLLLYNLFWLLSLEAGFR